MAAARAAAAIFRPIRAQGYCDALHLGLTPQAVNLTSLRRWIVAPISVALLPNESLKFALTCRADRGSRGPSNRVARRGGENARSGSLHPMIITGTTFVPAPASQMMWKRLRPTQPTRRRLWSA
jgi:hypothetical protein